MPEFWEEAFIDKQEMWGMNPAKSALLTTDFFTEKSIQNILIPGIGYGRNAQPFLTAGMTITGIEISQTAIGLAHQHFGTAMTIYHGSVTDMPFDDQQYEGIFCHALLHLLDKQQRAKLIEDCYRQLTEGGIMVFTAITKAAPDYGKGKLISPDRYEIHKGAKIFYYDRESVEAEFGGTGLISISEVGENQPMYLITCKKRK